MIEIGKDILESLPGESCFRFLYRHNTIPCSDDCLYFNIDSSEKHFDMWRARLIQSRIMRHLKNIGWKWPKNKKSFIDLDKAINMYAHKACRKDPLKDEELFSVSEFL